MNEYYKHKSLGMFNIHFIKLYYRIKHVRFNDFRV